MNELINNGKNEINRTRRINFLLIGFIGVFLIILFKLTNIQILESEKYKLTAKKQYQSKVILSPSRGLIFDRNMNLLVSNSHSISVAADPNMINDADSVADLLSGIFDKDKNEYLEKLNNSNTSFIYLERKKNIEEIKGLDTLNIEGLIVSKEPTRIYNYGTLASQILGFTDINNKGQSGIERAFENELSGKEGYMIMQKDGNGNMRPDIDFPQKDPIKGNNIVLTIDINVQRLVEEELKKGTEYYKADRSKVVVVSVKTGEILALCSYPTFDPNNIQSGDTIGMKNTVISDIYEPGSTFKLITAAGSLEEKIENKSSIIATEGGSFDVHGNLIKDSHSSYSLTFQQTIEQSSNIGMMKIAKKLGSERFYKYARDFGFGIYTGIELPGENKGYLKRPIDFSPESLEYMAIGYQIMVNTVQLAFAYASIANNGLLMKPSVLKREIGLDGNILYENTPTSVRQVVSQNTAQTLNLLLTGVVERGTGKKAAIENVHIAGKTGTAQKLVNGKYSSNSHTATFLGYFPSEDPMILVAVVIDNPKSGEYYGGSVAAPIFQKIASRIINYTEILQTPNPEFLKTNFKNAPQKLMEIVEVKNTFEYVPNLIDLEVKDAIEILKEKGFSYEIINENNTEKQIKDYKNIVVTQSPLPNEKITNNIKVKLTVKSINDKNKKLITVPNVLKYSLRRAINKLVAEGFTVEINGSGRIIDQIPKPDTKQPPKSKIILFCKNKF
ncbi:MAG: PASTA domain-containing protein [Bacteroidetes bacterium]|nr:PASTA domain-containing protein [Bacteroidota bacterium]